MSSLPPKDIQRQIVPRWRPFSAALTSGELGPMAVRAGGPSAIDPDYAETLGKWEAEHTLEHAVELLEGAIVRGRTEDAKKVLLEATPRERELKLEEEA